jgi:predicted DNA-binding transcriptional regulator YafY
MRADRLLAIMLLLQTRGKMTAQSLAEKLEVSRRTILRDIDALSAAGVPVYAEGGHHGGITLDERYRTTLAGMQEREIRTLFIGDNSQLLGELGLGDVAERTLLKLRAVLPVAHQPSVEHMRQRILIDPAWWWRDTQPPATWEQIQQAVYEDRQILVTYERHSGEVAERVLDPYSLVAKSSIWYLVADHAGELRTYRVLRLRQVTLLATHFQRRGDYDLPTYWREQLRQFGELTSEYAFTLRVRADRMSFVKEIVPGRYQPLAAADGDGWVTVRFQLESIDLGKMLVFGLGEAAIVVEPLALHEAIMGSARAILDAAERERNNQPYDTE